MRKLKFYLFFCLAGAVAASCTDHSIENPIPETDRRFLITALDYNRFMFSANASANNKTLNDSIYNYSSAMVNYIVDQGSNFTNLANLRQVPISTTLSPERQARYDTLRAFGPGITYDTTYIKVIVLTLKEMIDLYEREKNYGQDTLISYSAGGEIPYLKSYLRRAQKIDSLQRK